MEAGRLTYWNTAYISTVPHNRSNICKDLSSRGLYSENLYGVSNLGGTNLPPIVDGNVISRRSERYRNSGQTERIIKPSKHGYHRHGNTPTYKLLKEVCEKLQVLVARKLSQSVPEVDKQAISNECEDKEFDRLRTEKPRGTNLSSCDSGIILDITDYSTNLSSSESVFLTPLPEDQLECVYKSQPHTQIHLYLPKVSDIPKAGDTCPIVSVAATIKGDHSDETSHHRDLTYCGDSFMNRHMQHMKSSSTKFPKIKAKASNARPRTKKAQLSRSKRSEKSSLLSKFVKNAPQNCDAKRDIDTRHETPVNVDFLNDVTTLISEEKNLSCTFSDLSSTDESDCKNSTKNSNRNSVKTNENENENKNNIPDLDCEKLSQMNQSSWSYKTLNDLNKDRFVNLSTCSIIHGCGDNFARRFKHGLTLGETVTLITTTAQ